MNQNMKKIAKLVVKGISTYSVGVVIDNIVKSTTPVGASTLTKVISHIGGFVLSGMVADHASEYVEKELSIIFGQEIPVEKTEETKEK